MMDGACVVSFFPMSFHSVPLLPFTVVFIIGILLRDHFAAALWIPVALFVLGGLMFIFRRRYAGLMCCAALLGYAISFVREPLPFPSVIDGRELPYSGMAVEVRHLEPTQVMVIRVDSCGDGSCRPFLVKLTTPSSLPYVEERDRVHFTSSLSPLVFEPDLPYETDFDRPLRLMGVVGKTFVRPDSLKVLYPEPGMANSIRRFRSRITLAIVDLPLSDGCKEFLNAVLTGDRSMLTPDMQELFSTNGLSHLLALSGLHVAIIAGVISVLLIPLAFNRRMRIVRATVVILFLWLFAVMTGLGPSVVRSVLMATLFFIALSIQRQRSPFNSLCVAALVILICDPHALYSVGFQLSFLAVGAILIFAEVINPFSQRRGLLHSIAAYPAVTLAAMAGTALMSAYYFNIFPLMFLPANFVAALIVPLVLAGGVVLIILEFAGIRFILLAEMVDGLFTLLQRSASWFGSFQWAVVDDVSVNLLTIAAWFVTLTFFGLWLYRRRAVYATSTLLCLAFTFCTVILIGAPDTAVEVYIPRNQDHSSIMIRNGNTLHVVTSAPQRSHEELRDDYGRKYHRYLLSRGIDSIRIVTPSPTSIEPVRICGKMYVLINDSRQIEAFTDKAAVKTEEAMVNTDKVHSLDYALVCAGFRGDIIELTATLDVDSVLLSADLNRRRHDRYFKELSEAGYNVRSLKRSPFRWRTESAGALL